MSYLQHIFFSFQILYQSDASNDDLFKKTIQPLLDLFIAGFNTSVLLYGESGKILLVNSYVSNNVSDNPNANFIANKINILLFNI